MSDDNIINGKTAQEVEISIVVPIFNEAENIPVICDKLQNVLEKMGAAYEIIFVDDGSTDLSLSRLLELKKDRQVIKVIHFRTNKGKSAALAAGFRQAAGRTLVTIDADYQESPESIPQLLKNLDNGLDLVSGWRHHRQDPTMKILASRLFNWIVRCITRTSFYDINCGFKAYRRDVFKRIEIYGELHRVVPILAIKQGFRVGEIKVEHFPRTHGISKFQGFTRGLHGIFDLLSVLFVANYRKKPLHFFGMSGFLMFCAGLGINLFLSLRYFLGFGFIGEHLPLLMLGILLMILGFQSFCMGLLGEMLIRRNLHDFPEKDQEIFR